jgi:hypothetical protein
MDTYDAFDALGKVFEGEGFQEGLSDKIYSSNLPQLSKNRWTRFLAQLGDHYDGDNTDGFKDEMENFFSMPTRVKLYWLTAEAANSQDVMVVADAQALFEIIISFSCKWMSKTRDKRPLASGILQQWKTVRTYLCCFVRWLSVSRGMEAAVTFTRGLGAVGSCGRCGRTHRDAVERTVMRSNAP